jgi:zeaxanthin glucosyltransferase
MARIVFMPFAEIGHTNATFGLARQLRARGHEVGYLSLQDVEEHVRSQGWEFTPLFEQMFPKGYLDATYALLRTRKGSLKAWLAAASELDSRARAQFSEVLHGADFEARLRKSRADMLLIDATYPLPALTARRLGIPAAIFSSTLPLGRDVAVPPLFTRITPGQGWWSGLGFTRAQIKELARQYPELGKLCDFGTHLQHGPRVKIATLVACCPQLDFRRASLEDLHYIGPCVDLQREERPLPPEVKEEGPPLVFCTLGTREEHVPKGRPFFQALLDAMARRRDLRLLLVVNKPLTAADFRIPPNAVVLSAVPQLAVLRKARLMITHGGLNSVKECICLGVPMLVFPLAHDQPGNAARVAYHGLGLKGDLASATPETISSMIDKVIGDPGYSARIRAMQEVFLAENKSERGPELVERLVARGSPVSG